jgi:hypothetical protein
MVRKTLLALVVLAAGAIIYAAVDQVIRPMVPGGYSQ